MNLLQKLLRIALVVLCYSMMASVIAAGAGDRNSESGKRKDYEKLKLAELVRRANAADSMAQFELGSRFNYGRGAPKNAQQALLWLRRAGQSGQREAQRLLAVKFYNGYDVAIDHEEALKWTQLLAESGDYAGQMTLASMYANGEGGPRNLVQSYAWYDIAATTAQQSDDDQAQQDAAQASELREKTGALLLPAELAEAQQVASDWWLKKEKVSLKPKAGKKPAARKKAVVKPKAAAKPPSMEKKPGAATNP